MAAFRTGEYELEKCGSILFNILFKAGRFLLNNKISVFIIADLFAHVCLHFDSISLILPLFWVHCGYFEY